MSHYRNNNTMPSDVGNGRQTSYSTFIGNQVGNNGHNGHSAPHGHHIGHSSESMDALVSQFGAMSLPAGSNHGAANMSQIQHHGYMAGQEQPVAYQGYSVPLHVGLAPEGAYGYSVSGQFPVQGNYAPLPVPYHAMPYTPGRVASYADRSSSEVPALENRRGSYSTTESTPATPFFGSASERGAGSRVGVYRSSYTTPSPEQVVMPGTVPKVSQPIDEELLELLKEDPKIPAAVPAVFTPPTHIKSIEQCLENRIHGNRNVYIRGLHPTTDDELLHRYASRFGTVEQSKAIIDTATGACKGFGFAKFADVRDSEKCIRGFYHLGYEVGFARESFNARLKAEGDEGSTNLYLSNLPKRLNESELNAIFTGYHVVSSKILRDSMGNSRGVGFARFETRDECEEIIKQFHGASIGDEGMLMQVRYADTPAQKELKRITAERRQFRTNEYNIGAYGTADVGIHPSIYQQAPWSRRSGVGADISYAPRVPVRTNIGGSANTTPVMSQGLGRTSLMHSIPSATASDDGSTDEGVTVVDSPTVKKGSTQSSPIKKESATKKEKS
ncbi:putative sporulation-specific protein 5 [Triangularia verruculosa]|uniref:Sporulation-specific protein 5 n=1 Tax=Triangularia verruculosa TaxID=2587418 RepID=A0AAN6XGD5_9PEZI|nr:putative sporulation-specific protein 5 [Triangularia verruculosa]